MFTIIGTMIYYGT